MYHSFMFPDIQCFEKALVFPSFNNSHAGGSFYNTCNQQLDATGPNVLYLVPFYGQT